MAHKDFRAILQMTDEGFDIEIFGFHAQQTVEKCLKAWIRQSGGIPPLTHNLSILFARLEELGQDTGIWQDLVELNSFAVQLRYQEIDDEAPDLNRQEVIEQIERLLTSIDKLVGYSE